MHQNEVQVASFDETPAVAPGHPGRMPRFVDQPSNHAMFLDPFFREDQGLIRISAAQGSAFAKGVAGDFNPLHDADNPRFCVPGDLLFALVLARHGVSSHMSFRFTGMVGAEMPFQCVQDGGLLVARDEGGKTCLEVDAGGSVSQDASLIESLVRRYVAFSGRNFPHILVPLMESRGVMINTDRPLVVYESMSFEMDRLDLVDLELDLVDSQLTVNGRRGEARLVFAFSSGGEPVGNGCKTLILSGLREHDPVALQGFVDRYVGWQTAFEASGGGR